MRVGGQRHAPAVLPPAQRTDTHRNGCWVGPIQQTNNEHLQDANGHPATGSRHGTAASVLWLAAGQSQQSTCGKRPAVGKQPTARVHRPAACGHRPVSGYQSAATWLQDISWPVISGQRLTSLKVSDGGQGIVVRLRSAASSLADASCHRTATGHGQAVCGLSAASRRPAVRNLQATNANPPLVSSIGHWSSASRRPAICGRP